METGDKIACSHFPQRRGRSLSRILIACMKMQPSGGLVGLGLAAVKRPAAHLFGAGFQVRRYRGFGARVQVSPHFSTIASLLWIQRWQCIDLELSLFSCLPPVAPCS